MSQEANVVDFLFNDKWMLCIHFRESLRISSKFLLLVSTDELAWVHSVGGIIKNITESVNLTRLSLFLHYEVDK